MVQPMWLDGDIIPLCMFQSNRTTILPTFLLLVAGRAEETESGGKTTKEIRKHMLDRFIEKRKDITTMLQGTSTYLLAELKKLFDELPTAKF